MRVTMKIFDTELDGDYGMVPSIEAVCSKCGHTVEVFGQDDPSIRRAGHMLREECPSGENNYYEADRV